MYIFRRAKIVRTNFCETGPWSFTTTSTTNHHSYSMIVSGKPHGHTSNYRDYYY